MKEVLIMNEGEKCNLKVLLLFSVILISLSLGDFGVHSIGNYVYIDLLITPVIFVIILTNLTYSVFIGFVWGVSFALAPGYTGNNIMFIMSTRLLASIAGHYAFRLNCKKNTSMTFKILSTIVVTNITLFISDLSCVLLFNIYGLNSLQVWAEYTPKLFLSIIINICSLFVIDLFLKKKLRVAFVDNDVNNIRIIPKSKDYPEDHD
jgi:hypothetical protein